MAVKAKAAAEAELDIFPLVRFLGSPTQRDARAAQARLEELIARPETGSTGRPATTKLQETHVAKVQTVGPEQRARPQKPELPPRMTVAARTEATQPTTSLKPPRTPLPPPRPAIRARTVEAIVYDLETGIKTVHMSDGSVEESLFDPTELPASESSAVPGKPRISIVNRGPAPTESDADPARKAASNR
jgi:hypothetical protein